MLDTRIDENLQMFYHVLEAKAHIGTENIQELLDAFRMKFQVDLVFIGEMRGDRGKMMFGPISVSTDPAEFEGVVYRPVKEEKPYSDHFDEDGLCSYYVTRPEGRGTYSVLYEGIYRGQDFTGRIGMASFDCERLWTEEERAAVSKLAHVLSPFVSMHRLERNSLENQERIQRQNNALESIFVTTECGMMRHTIDGSRVLSINQAALTILGYESKEELMEEGFNLIAASVHKDDQPKLRNVIKKLRKIGDSASVDYRVVHKNGDILEVIGGIKLLEEDGVPIYQRFLCDCTEQRVHEKRKQQEKEKVYDEMIYALSMDFNTVCFVDLDTGLGTIFRMNEDITRRFGSALSGEVELEYGMNLYIENLVYQDDRNLLRETISRENLKKVLKTKESVYLNYRTLRDGVTEYFQVKAVRVGSWEKKHSIVLGFRSVDEEICNEMEQKRRLEEALAQAERGSRAKTTFLNNMSHDIRTPMNAIMGFTALACTHLDQKELVRDYLSKIMTSSNHLLSLINDVLDMSRIESGKMRIEEKECHLPDVMHDLKNILQADIHSKQLEFMIDTVDVVNEDVFCDKLRLNQILLNCLSNAMKFTGPGGKIGVRMIQKAGAPKGYASFDFKIFDTGIGISEEFLNHIFEPFERERSTTVSGIQGTGLGMAITKNIVDMMHGSIQVISKEGKGTVFTISLTFRISGNPCKVNKLPFLKGARALVVDDDFNTCKSVTKMLADMGLRTDWTTSGKEAVLRAGFARESNDDYRVYIIDWLMPDMNGIECVRRIRKSIGKQVPVIVLTAYDWTDIQEEAEDAGVSAFCSKPLFFSELKETLETICEDEPKKHLQNLEDIISFPDYHILLVEDVELNCEIAEEILKEAGLRVTSAANGQEAVEVISQAAEDEFDLILMDIQMPVMDGYEACRRIRKLENKKKAGIPILAMTADAFEEDRIRALQAGMDGHLSKPISREVLYRELNRHLKVNEKPEPGKNEGSICHARNTDRETCSKMQEI